MINRVVTSDAIGVYIEIFRHFLFGAIVSPTHDYFVEAIAVQHRLHKPISLCSAVFGCQEPLFQVNHEIIHVGHCRATVNANRLAFIIYLAGVTSRTGKAHVFLALIGVFNKANR